MSNEAIERTIAGIWAAALHVEDVTGDDDFLALGGDSIAAIVVSARVAKALGIRSTVAEIFDTPTLRDYAAVVTALTSSSPAHLERS